MQVQILKSKIHRGAVTDSNMEYEGSMTIDQDLMDMAGMVPYERILASNLANGSRFETYVIPGVRGSRVIVLNGATAHLGKVGDRLTIMSFTTVPMKKARHWHPQVVLLDAKNKVTARRPVVKAKRGTR